MSTDDKPLLTEWTDDGDGWHQRFLASDRDDVRVRVTLPAYLIWGEDSELLADGSYFASVTAACAAADAAARQWYTLPSPTAPPPVAAASTCACGRDVVLGTATGMCAECWLKHVRPTDDGEEWSDEVVTPAPAAPLPAPASEGATAHPQPDATGADDDRRWDELFAATQPQLDRMAVAARAEMAAAPPDATGAEVLAMETEANRVTALLLDKRGPDEDDENCRECGGAVDWRDETGDVCDVCASAIAYELAHALRRACTAVSRLQADHARLVEAARNLVNDERVTAWGPCDTDNPESYDCPADRWNALVEALGGGQ